MDGRFLLPGTVKQGYLTKSPPLDKGTSVFKQWKKRWCILYLSQRELFIQYYENEESTRGSSTPKSTVSLRFCEKVDADLEHSHYKNVFGIRLPERVYYFSAPSNFEMNEWVDAICTHLNLRDQTEPSKNLYSVSPQPLPSHTLNTMPTLSPPNSTHYSSSPTLPIRNMSPVSYPSQYGTLSAMHMGPGVYGTSPSRGPPPTPPPPYSGSISSNGTPFDINGQQYSPRLFPPSPNLSMQHRSLPPIPPPSSPTDSAFISTHNTPPSVPPRRNSQQPNQQEEPPVPPPRQGSAVQNVYFAT